MKNEDKEYRVYAHICPDDTAYYGKSSQEYINCRWRKGDGYKNQRKFKAKIDEFGWDNIEHVILAEQLDAETAAEMETRLIDENGGVNSDKVLNLSTGGDAGFTFSDNTKELISKNNLKRYKDHPEMRENLRQKAIKRYKEHPELKEEASKRQSDRLKNNPSLKEKMIEGRRKFNEDHPEVLQKLIEDTKVKVNQYDLSGNCIATYDSIVEASRVTGISRDSIYGSAAGKYHLGGGFMWRYADRKIDPIMYPTKEVGKLKAVYKIDKDTGEIIDEFCSLTEATKSVNGSISQISQCVHGHIEEAYGFKWRFVNEEHVNTYLRPTRNKRINNE